MSSNYNATRVRRRSCAAAGTPHPAVGIVDDLLALRSP